MNALMRPNPVRAGLQAGGSAYGTIPSTAGLASKRWCGYRAATIT
jgi:hypothetical protein